MSELLKISESFTALSVFNCDNTQTIIDKIRAEATAEIFDINTAKGRKGVASMAHKVAKSKVALDNLGKELVLEWKVKAKAVDAERKKLRDELDVIKEEVRAPLTAWEEATAKAAAEKAAIEKLAADHEEAIKEDGTFNAYRELERQREEIEVEKQRLHDEEQARVAAQQAEAAAKAAELAEIERVALVKRNAEIAAEKAAKEKVEAAERENQRIIDEAARAKVEAQEAAQRAEIKARVEKEQAALAAKQAAEDAAKAAQAAKEAAIQRVKDDQAAKEAAHKLAEEQKRAAQEKQAKNRAHRAKINNAMLEDLLKLGLDDTACKKIITAAAKNKIRFLTVNY